MTEKCQLPSEQGGGPAWQIAAEQKLSQWRENANRLRMRLAEVGGEPYVPIEMPPEVPETVGLAAKEIELSPLERYERPWCTKAWIVEGTIRPGYVHEIGGFRVEEKPKHVRLLLQLAHTDGLIQELDADFPLRGDTPDMYAFDPLSSPGCKAYTLDSPGGLKIEMGDGSEDVFHSGDPVKVSVFLHRLCAPPTESFHLRLLATGVESVETVENEL